jgi:hypothetical protein
MAYIVARSGGAWEIRESRTTPRGPRSQTLATFRVLAPEVIAQALERAAKPLRAQDLRQTAIRAGAPIAPSPPNRAAGELLAEMANGRRPREALRQLLIAALGEEHDGAADNALAAGAWIAATPAQRGEALRDLLLLADRLPPRRPPSGRPPSGRSSPRPRFPRIQTTPA